MLLWIASDAADTLSMYLQILYEAEQICTKTITTCMGGACSNMIACSDAPITFLAELDWWRDSLVTLVFH